MSHSSSLSTGTSTNAQRWLVEIGHLYLPDHATVVDGEHESLVVFPDEHRAEVIAEVLAVLRSEGNLRSALLIQRWEAER